MNIKQPISRYSHPHITLRFVIYFVEFWDILMYVVCLVGPSPVVAVSYVGSCKSPVNLLFYTLTLLFLMKLGRGKDIFNVY